MDELQKLLDSTTTALQPEDLEPILVDTIYKLAPAWSCLNQATAEAKVHEFNQRTGLPTPNFEGENAVTSSSNSQYTRQSVTLKIMRQKGGVTNVAQLSMQRFIDAFKTELLGATKAMGWQIEAGVLWGNSVADQYQFSGLDNLIETNVVDWNAPVSLSLLDNLIDASDDAGGEGHDRVFILGSKIRSSLTRILRNQFHAPELITVRNGLTLPGYRGIPLMASTGVRAYSQMTSVASSQTTSGSLTTSQQYFWSVAPVTVDGEQQASATTTQTMSGSNHTVNLSWTAYPGAFLYKVYRGTATNAMGLVAAIAANTYDGSGTVSGQVSTYSDAGTVSPNMLIAPLSAGDQVVFLLDRNSDESAEIRYLSERQNIIQYLDLAPISDQKEFLLRSFMALVMKYEAVNGMARRVQPV
jgi:hypothetical protein